MSRGSRLALGTVALALLISPAITLHPAAAHLYAAGFSSLASELAHADFLGLATLALLAALPTAGFVAWLLLAAREPGCLRTITSLSRTARLDGLAYRLLPCDAIVVFTAGIWRPSTFVSEGAAAALPPGELRAALLHELGHQRHHDIPWKVLMKAVARGLPFLPWLRRAVETETLLDECAADEFAVRHGASRRELFDAIALAATAPSGPLVASVAGGDIEIRMRRLVHPETPLPRRPTGGFLAAATALLLLAVSVHMFAAVAFGASRLIA